MLNRTIGAVALAAMLSAATATAQAQVDAKYPDWKGQWVRLGGVQGGQWDPSKPPGRGQQPPLTAEYRAIWEAALANRPAGAGDMPTGSCLPPGMPQTMINYESMEIIVMPDTTYLTIGFMNEFRRVFTDGRKWPDDIEPSYTGYSIGHWEDTDGDGKYDTLVVETRGMKGPRTFDASGMPLHKDNETVVKERIHLDKANPDILHDEVTTTDHALTRPWTVTQSYRRERNPVWTEYVCAENNQQVIIGTESYTVSEDGYLKPTRRDQPPPDLRYFNRRR
jgi:hypothetical protein